MLNVAASSPGLPASIAAAPPPSSAPAIGNLPVQFVAASPDKPDIRDRPAQPEALRRREKRQEAAEGFSLRAGHIASGPAGSVSAFHAQLLAQSDAAAASQWLAWQEG